MIDLSVAVGGFKDRQARRREVFSKALAACNDWRFDLFANSGE